MAKIWNILRRRFPENEYALMQEVSDASGFNRSRSADYIAVNLYPSRGLAINGIELKSYRNDWLNELKNPKKAENIFKYCDYFWLLTADDKIAKLEEIPSTWGWLCIKGERVFTKKVAPILKPIPVSRDFMCAMLKRACDKKHFVHIDSIKDEMQTRIDNALDSYTREQTKRQNELQGIKELISEFEKSSGISLREFTQTWNYSNPKKMGEAFKFVNDGGTDSIKEELLRLEKTTQTILEKISKGLKTLS